MLIIRGRCRSSQKGYFRSNMVLDNLLLHWAQEERPFAVSKEGSDETGGGDPVPEWLDGGHCVRDGFCQCNLIGITQAGAPMMVNSQGCHHPGPLYTNSFNIINGHSQEFKCRCLYSRVKVHHATVGCSRHIMNMHIATNLIRSVIGMLARAKRGPRSSYVPRSLSRQEK